MGVPARWTQPAAGPTHHPQRGGPRRFRLGGDGYLICGIGGTPASGHNSRLQAQAPHVTPTPEPALPAVPKRGGPAAIAALRPGPEFLSEGLLPRPMRSDGRGLPSKCQANPKEITQTASLLHP